MVVRRKKKVLKFRGKRSYGYGSHKKHRGGGSRGGRGKAGMHKHKWSYTVKYDPDHFGKRGFKRPFADYKKPKSVNLGKLEIMVKGKKKVDVKELGYTKVIGGGRIKSAMEIVAQSFSKKAIEKIQEAGGKAVIAEKPKVELEKPKED